jgi:hypothetical protein
MHATIDVKRLMPVWDQFRAATDIAPARGEDGAARPEATQPL